MNKTNISVEPMLPPDKPRRAHPITSEPVGPRTSRSAGLSRRYKSTASARFPGRGRAHYEGFAAGSEIHPLGAIQRWHVPVPSSRPGLRRYSRPLLPDERAIRTRLPPESASPPAPSRDLESTTAGAGPRPEQACPPGRPVSPYRPVQMQRPCRRPRRPTLQLQPARKKFVSYGASFNRNLNPCVYPAKIADHGSQQASSHNGNWNQSKPLIRAPRFGGELCSSYMVYTFSCKLFFSSRISLNESHWRRTR